MQRAAQLLQPSIHRGDGGGDFRSAHAGSHHLGRDVAHQKLYLAHRPDLPEELRRDIRHLMRFIQDDGFRARQEIAKSLVFEREIREQQMVIHDDDVGRLSVAPGLEHMTTRELGTLLA